MNTYANSRDPAASREVIPERPGTLPRALLVLDFDGVLQTPALDGWLEMEHAHHVEDLLKQLGHVDVLVSSSHREGRTLSEVRGMLPPLLASRTVGTTPVLPQGRAKGGRQIEIETWLRGMQWHRPWIAVDDEPYLFEPSLARLVQTHPWLGWTCDTSADVVRRLTAVGV